MLSPPLYRRAIPADARITRWIGPDGWSFRRLDWAAKRAPRGAILFLPGRGDIFEKYLETFAHWRARGWSITALDWRGQGGSGRFAERQHVGDIDDFATYIADFRAFWAGWAPAATPGPRVLIGHSMGGHLALRALVEGAADPAATVLVAPMLGLRSPLGARGGERMARWMAGRGDPGRPAWRGNERPGTFASRQALLTRDSDRYEDEIFWQTSKPELLLGPPSWRWLAGAFGSTRALREDPRLATMTVPVLMLVADADKLVAPAAARAIAGRLPNAEVVRFGRESAHEILREADPVRDRAIAAIDAFLAARAG